MTIEPPDESDYAPGGTVQVVILTSGQCDSGCSDRLWLRKGKKGWRVLKKLDGKCWETYAQARAVEQAVAALVGSASRKSRE